jgi:hypothetical protein
MSESSASVLDEVKSDGSFDSDWSEADDFLNKDLEAVNAPIKRMYRAQIKYARGLLREFGTLSVVMYSRCCKYDLDQKHFFGQNVAISIFSYDSNVQEIALRLFTQLSLRCIDKGQKRKVRNCLRLINKVVPGDLVKLMTIATKTLGRGQVTNRGIKDLAAIKCILDFKLHYCRVVGGKALNTRVKVVDAALRLHEMLSTVQTEKVNFTITTWQRGLKTFVEVQKTRKGYLNYYKALKLQHELNKGIPTRF